MAASQQRQVRTSSDSRPNAGDERAGAAANAATRPRPWSRQAQWLNTSGVVTINTCPGRQGRPPFLPRPSWSSVTVGGHRRRGLRQAKGSSLRHRQGRRDREELLPRPMIRRTIPHLVPGEDSAESYSCAGVPRAHRCYRRRSVRTCDQPDLRVVYSSGVRRCALSVKSLGSSNAINVVHAGGRPQAAGTARAVAAVPAPGGRRPAVMLRARAEGRGHGAGLAGGRGSP